jgi:hypothetical protein
MAEIAKKGAGVHEVPLPPSVQGRAFLSDGTETTVDMAIVVVKKMVRSELDILLIVD